MLSRNKILGSVEHGQNQIGKLNLELFQIASWFLIVVTLTDFIDMLNLDEQYPAQVDMENIPIQCRMMLCFDLNRSNWFLFTVFVPGASLLLKSTMNQFSMGHV